MEILIISDVPANVLALDPVLEQVGEVDLIVHAGKILGVGPFPNEIIDRFKEIGVVAIVGNRDLAVLTGNFDFRRSPRR